MVDMDFKHKNILLIFNDVWLGLALSHIKRNNTINNKEPDMFKNSVLQKQFIILSIYTSVL